MVNVTNIVWDITIEDIGNIAKSLSEMPIEKASSFLGVPKDTFSNMYYCEILDHLDDMRIRGYSELYEILCLPENVVIDNFDNCSDSDILEDLSIEYGYFIKDCEITRS